MRAMTGERLGRGFRFGLPPSLGWEPVKELARRFADLLYAVGFDTVIPYQSYEGLQSALLAGDVEAAWAPPAVCARIEGAGGQVALRAVREGGLTYRSALLVRAHDPIDVSRLNCFSPRELRAAWVDRFSMAGFLLPRDYLRKSGVQLETAFVEEIMLGSYQACIRAVVEGDADITASFARRGTNGPPQYFSANAKQLRVLGLSDESPNDGIAISSALEPEMSRTLRERLCGFTAQPSCKRILTRMFDIEDFDFPAAGTYRGLLVYV
jgi:phosphonate transport system substrate-binding protein